MKGLHLLYKDFIAFLRVDFNLKAYLFTFLLIAASIAFVYIPKRGASFLGGEYTITKHYLMYTALYFTVLVANSCFRKTYTDLLKPMLYFKVLLLMGLLSMSDAFSWKEYIDFDNLAIADKQYVFKVLWRSRNALFVLPVLVLLRIFVDRDVKGLYGLTSENQHIKVYLILFCCITPFLVYASFTPDFQSYYPSYKAWYFGEAFGRPVWLNTVLYETVYMFDFLMVELFFRGMLVIGMASLLGRKAVLPMVAIYVALHFGKPVLETMSAMFGGFALGTLAFQTRHIWGGVIIHMGIALLIELLGLWQHYG